MKALFVFLLTCCGVVHASDWSDEDTERQAIYLTLHVIDWRQTQDIGRHPGYHEMNSAIGEHPSNARINTYMTASAILTTAIAYELPPEWRRYWQYSGIIIKASLIGGNFKVGLSAGF